MTSSITYSQSDAYLVTPERITTHGGVWVVGTVIADNIIHYVDNVGFPPNHHPCTPCPPPPASKHS